MTPIDSNVLVRFLIADDRPQAQAVRALVDSVLEKGETVYISKIILVETLWVLDSVYHLTKTELLSVLNDLLTASFVTLEDSACVERAIRCYQIGAADFSDYLVAVSCNHLGLSPLYTFDKKCKEKELFKQV